MCDIINDYSLLRLLQNAINLREDELQKHLEKLDECSKKAARINDVNSLTYIQELYTNYKSEFDLIQSLQEHYVKNPKRL